MCLFVFAVPAAGEIQYHYHAKPDKIDTAQAKAEVVGLEHNGALVRVVYLAAVMAGDKENGDRNEPDQIPMTQVVKERHITIDIQYPGKFILNVFR